MGISFLGNVLGAVIRGIEGIADISEYVTQGGRSGGIYGSVDGLEELTRQFQSLGVNFPKRALQRAANVGIKQPLKLSRSYAPKDSGELKKGIIKVLEKSPRMKKKAVYQIVFDKSKISIFKGKKIIRPGLYGASPPKQYGYYPVSQEYGWKVKYGKHEGHHFLKRAIEQTTADSQRKIIDQLGKEIDKILARTL